jgi:hypothetical protein
MVAEKTLVTNYFPRNPDQPNIFTDAIDDLDSNEDLDLSDASSDDLDDPGLSDASTDEINSEDDFVLSDVSNDDVFLKYDHDSLNAFESEEDMHFEA